MERELGHLIHAGRGCEYRITGTSIDEYYEIESANETCYNFMVIFAMVVPNITKSIYIVSILWQIGRVEEKRQISIWKCFLVPINNNLVIFVDNRCIKKIQTMVLLLKFNCEFYSIMLTIKCVYNVRNYINWSNHKYVVNISTVDRN